VRARRVAERGGAGVQRGVDAAVHVFDARRRAAALAARRGAHLRPRRAAGGAGECPTQIDKKAYQAPAASARRLMLWTLQDLAEDCT